MESITPVSTRLRPLMWLCAAMGVVGAVTTPLIAAQGVATPIDSRALGGAATILVAGTLGFVYCRLWLTNARLLVGADTFGYRDIVGRQRTWAAAEAGAVIDVDIAYNKRTTQRAVFVLALDGRRLMAINPIAWPPNTVDRVARAAGRSVEHPEPMAAAAFRRAHPRAMGWATTHPNLMGGLLAVGLITVAIAVPIATIWLHP